MDGQPATYLCQARWSQSAVEADLPSCLQSCRAGFGACEIAATMRKPSLAVAVSDHGMGELEEECSMGRAKWNGVQHAILSSNNSVSLRHHVLLETATKYYYYGGCCPTQTTPFCTVSPPLSRARHLSDSFFCAAVQACHCSPIASIRLC